MIYVDDALINAYNQPARDITAQIDFCRFSSSSDPFYTITDDTLISLSIKSSLASGSQLSLGNISTKQLDFQMVYDERLMRQWSDIDHLVVKIGIKPQGETEYIMTTVGVFYISSFESPDHLHTLSVTAYDIMKKFDSFAWNDWMIFLRLYADYNSEIFTYATMPYTGLEANGTAIDINRVALRTAQQCDYNPDGEQISTAGSYGVGKDHLVFIPAYVKSVTLVIHSRQKYTTPLKVCLYGDLNGNELSSSSYGYRTYTGYSVSEEESGYKITQKISISLLANLFPLYMGISIAGDETLGEGDTYEIELQYPDHTPILSGVSTLNWDELSSHTPIEMLKYGIATLGCNMICANDPDLYPRRYLSNDETSGRIILEDGNPPSDVRFIPYQETGFEITPDIQYMNEFTTKQFNPLKISYVTSGSDDTPYTEKLSNYATGDAGLNFTDTMFDGSDQSNLILQTIIIRYSDLNNVMTGKVKYRGNPFVEVGDIIIVQGSDGTKYQFIVGSNELRYSGGLSCTVTSGFEVSQNVESTSIPATRSVTESINAKESNILNKVKSLKVLWSGESRLGQGETINLSEPISDQLTEIILEWKLASNGTSSPYGDAAYQYLPKTARGSCVFNSGGVVFTTNCRKRIQVNDQSITGTEYNTQSGTAVGGAYDNSKLVLTAVYGK